MAWEKRGNKSYYYRKNRMGNRVISEYVGAGPRAELVAFLDEEDRQRREYERQQWQEEKAIDRAQIDQVDDAMKLIRQITGAACIAGGCYQHKRQWRRYAADTD